MESAFTWENKALINELTQGLEKAKQLRIHLCSTFPSEAQDLLLRRIISTFEKALMILKWGASVGQAQECAALPAARECSVSMDGSPRSDDMNKNFGDHRNHGDVSRKRKSQPIWTEQVKVNSENALEGPGDDGYSWRKYGQKDILGAKYPRSYYRCTYRLVRDCWATKQVQRSDEDLTIFDVTYKGRHTCNQSINAVPPPASLEKRELKNNNSHYQLEQQNQTLANFTANLRVNTEELDIKEMPTHFSFQSTFACRGRENHCSPISALADDNQLGTYSPVFYSPATTESNYSSAAANYHTRNHVEAPIQQSETDTADIISAHASTTNSPTGGMEFSIDPVYLDPNFPFNIPGFFT
ncbi:probable WRKY transcription factor 53 [Sesamum indicum]|uniref:Probable WRKY transcription factor 53 n=1 Tax=Sesamum indicum TaxID=4182 RepID=A0A6I9V0D6_SESIN|nr:probable WRKY transcription factor 53 [Sesamum indicum]